MPRDRSADHCFVLRGVMQLALDTIMLFFEHTVFLDGALQSLPQEMDLHEFPDFPASAGKSEMCHQKLCMSLELVPPRKSC